MMTVRDYRERAQECERLARQASSEKQREEFVRIAASWRKLAAESVESEASAAGGNSPACTRKRLAAAVGAKNDDQRCNEQGGEDAERQCREGQRGQ